MKEWFKTLSVVTSSLIEFVLITWFFLFIGGLAEKQWETGYLSQLFFGVVGIALAAYKVYKTIKTLK